MITLQIVSDLHIEFKNDDVPDPLIYITPSSDVLVLAGDIGSLYKTTQLSGFLKKLCPHFHTVLYIPGNHEYYTVQNCELRTMSQLIYRLHSMAKDIPNLYILDRSSVKIGDICIAGCTLWSKPYIEVPNYIVRIHEMSTEMYQNKHENDLKYINHMIKYCRDKKYKLVVVTHYPPTYKVLEGSKKRTRIQSLYATNLEELLQHELVNTWICGHTHKNFDLISKEGTRVISNQKGKPKDKVNDYFSDFIITI